MTTQRGRTIFRCFDALNQDATQLRHMMTVLLQICTCVCCPCHCTCYDKYTHIHLYTCDDDISCNALHSHEIYLSENKPRLYWDRTHDIPDKARSGIESICYGKDVSDNVLDWFKKNLVHLHCVIESNTDGIPLLVKSELVCISLKANAEPWH